MIRTVTIRMLVDKGNVMVGCDLVFVITISAATMEMMACAGLFYDAVESPRPLHCGYYRNNLYAFENFDLTRKLGFWTAGFV